MSTGIGEPAPLGRSARRGLKIESGARSRIFALNALDQRRHALPRMNPAHALSGAPDIAPRLGRSVAAGAEVHFRFVRLREVIGVKTGARDAAAQVIAVHAAEQRGVQ